MKMPWVIFLTELRSRLLRAMILFFVILLVFVWFANPLYEYFASPLLRYLPNGHLIATEIASPFFVPFRLSCTAAFFLSAPIFLYQIWLFVAPALYINERKLMRQFFASAVILFYGGVCFAFFVLLPLLFQFLTKTVPSHVVMSPDISQYLDFTLSLLLVFGFLFEIPIVMLLLSLSRIVSGKTFLRYRGYAVVGSFIVGMFLAPPDVFSQTMLAVPIWLLYEAGIFLALRADQKQLR